MEEEQDLLADKKYKECWETAVVAVRAFTKGRELTEEERNSFKTILSTRGGAKTFFAIFPSESQQLMDAGIIDPSGVV